MFDREQSEWCAEHDEARIAESAAALRSVRTKRAKTTSADVEREIASLRSVLVSYIRTTQEQARAIREQAKLIAELQARALPRARKETALDRYLLTIAQDGTTDAAPDTHMPAALLAALSSESDE